MCATQRIHNIELRIGPIHQNGNTQQSDRQRVEPPVPEIIMKKTILALSILFATQANSMTDWMCMQDCQNRGYIYQYCLRVCSY